MIAFRSREEFYKAPFGAAAEGESIRIRVTAPRKLGVCHLSLLLFPDGASEPRAIPLYFIDLAGSREIYEARFSVEQEGLYWYRFSCKLQGTPASWGRGADGTPVREAPESWQLTVYEKDYRTPDWLKGGILYQIFPDRFFRSREYFPVLRQDAKLRTDWGGTPEYIRYEDGSVPNNDFFGGNLAGIQEKLDYLERLGVNCIYLNPIFEAASNHKYDTGDYEKIDGMFGDEKAFRSLCRAAKDRGIHIILDGVFSHTGADSRYFNKEGNYPEIGAYQSRESKYFPWYHFDNWPEEYRGWWGVGILPEVDELEPSFLNYITGPEGIAAKWMEAGASGYRLDVADELPDGFLDAFRRRVKKVSPEGLILGEVWEDASNKMSYGVRRRYLRGRQLDSVMNYVFKDAVIDFVKNGGGGQLAERIEIIAENYPEESLHCLMNLLGTHDTPRILTVLGSREKLKIAAVLLYFLPGVPCIFYGDEAGLAGEGDPFCRGCYPWGNEDRELLAFYRLLGKIRKENRNILKDGKYFTSYSNEDIICYRREKANQRLYVVVNRSEKSIAVNLKQLGVFSDQKSRWKNLLNGKMLEAEILLSGNSSVLFLTEGEEHNEEKQNWNHTGAAVGAVGGGLRCR